MIKWSRVCGIAIFCTMLGMVGGCSKDTSTVSEVMEEIKTTEVSDTEDDKLNMDDVILQVGDASITYREVLFYVYQVKRDYEDEFGKEVWEVALKDGNSFESYAIEELLRQLTEIHIICEQAKKDNVALTQVENAEIENRANKFLSNVTEEEAQKYGFVKESVENIFKEHAIAKKMYDKEVQSVVDTTNKGTEEARKKMQSEHFQSVYTEWSKQYSAEVSVKLWQKIEMKMN